MRADSDLAAILEFPQRPEDRLRLSLRLLSTGRLIEREVDALMRARFDEHESLAGA